MQGPVIRLPDHNKPLYLNTDTSIVAIGGILMQLDEQSNHLHVVHFSLHLLGPAQRNYSIPMQECLGDMHFLTDWCKYFGDQVVNIFSDQHALGSVISNTFSSNCCIMRWAIAISDVNFTIQHVKDKMSDALSHLIGTGVEIKMYEEHIVSAIAVRIKHIHSHAESMVPLTQCNLYCVSWAGFTKRHDSGLPTEEVPAVLLAEWDAIQLANSRAQGK